MRENRTQGIVLHKRLIGDQDVFVTIITRRFGRLDAIAKGAKKITSKFVSSLDVLNVCEFNLYQGPKTWIIRDATILENFQTIKTKLERAAQAHLMAALLYKTAHGADEYSQDFLLFKKALQSLNNTNKNIAPQRIFEEFSKNLLVTHGLGLSTSNAQQQYDPVRDF